MVQFGSQPVELFVVEGLEHRLGGRGDGGESIDGADCGVGGHGEFSERLRGRCKKADEVSPVYVER